MNDYRMVYTKENVQDMKNRIYLSDNLMFLLQLPFKNPDGAARIIDVSRSDALYLVGNGIYTMRQLGDNTFVLTPAVQPDLNIDYGTEPVSLIRSRN